MATCVSLHVGVSFRCGPSCRVICSLKVAHWERRCVQSGTQICAFRHHLTGILSAMAHDERIFACVISNQRALRELYHCLVHSRLCTRNSKREGRVYTRRAGRLSLIACEYAKW